MGKGNGNYEDLTVVGVQTVQQLTKLFSYVTGFGFSSYM